jgi:hypothetical protein
MNDAQLHLLVNHIPIIGGALVMLILVYAMAVRSSEVTRVALGFTVLVSLGTIAPYLTGEGAEEIVEHAEEIAAERIEEHEERAEKAAYTMWTTGGLALLGLLVGRRRNIPNWASRGTLVLLIVTNGLMAWAAKAGGEISHPETRPGFVAPAEGDHQHGGHAHDQNAQQDKSVSETEEDEGAPEDNKEDDHNTHDH